MILADSSVWIDHFRRPDPQLTALLDANRIVIQAYVLGELAMGSLARRGELLHRLSRLPELIAPRPREVLSLVNGRNLFGRGIGFVDATLIASCLLSRPAKLWTRDRRLEAAAHDCGVDLFGTSAAP